MRARTLPGCQQIGPLCCGSRVRAPSRDSVNEFEAPTLLEWAAEERPLVTVMEAERAALELLDKCVGGCTGLP